MKTLLVFAATLFVAVPTLADPPALTLPEKVSGQSGAFLKVAAKTTGKNVRWLALDEGLNLFPVDLLKDSHTAVVSSGKAGTYRLLAITASGDEISDPVICRVVIQGSTPTPTPPSPTPPPPSPTGAAAWAIVVLDNTARTPAIGQLIGSPTLFAALQKRGVTLRVLDVTDPLVKKNGYQASVDAAGGPPVLLVYDSKGVKLKVARFPSDEASFLAEFPTSATTRRTPVLRLMDCPTCPGGKCVITEMQP